MKLPSRCLWSVSETRITRIPLYSLLNARTFSANQLLVNLFLCGSITALFCLSKKSGGKRISLIKKQALRAQEHQIMKASSKKIVPHRFPLRVVSMAVWKIGCLRNNWCDEDEAHGKDQEGYVEYALAQIKNMEIRMKYLLFDGGFSSLTLRVYLQNHGYRYIIRFTPQ
jgi:hypothetical protein